MFQKIFALVFISLLFISCDSSTEPDDKKTVEIDFPFNKKTVYASATYMENIGGRELNSLRIFSIEYVGYTKDIVTEYVGNIETAYYFKDNLFPIDSSYFPKYGQITVSIDDKWVKFQKSDIFDIINTFMKVNNSKVDTTELPTKDLSQFPSYPSIIETNSRYSAFRPGNSGDDWGYINLQRNFKSGKMKTYSDSYGESIGIQLHTEHLLQIGNTISLTFNSIIDKEGMIISQESSPTKYIDPDGNEKSVIITTITRRIVDFIEPEKVRDLNYYMELVKQNGLDKLDF